MIGGFFPLLPVLLLGISPAPSVRIIGLVEVPRIFGLQDPTGPPGARRPGPSGPVSLYMAPSAGADVALVVSDGGQLETREFDYEQAAAVVYERRVEWFRVGYRDAGELKTAWLAPSDAGTFHGVLELIGGHPFLTDAWDGRLYSAAAGPSQAGARRMEARGATVAVLDSTQVAGEWWLEIGFYDRSPCEAPPAQPTIVTTGWVALYNDADELQLWFRSRGC